MEGVDPDKELTKLYPKYSLYQGMFFDISQELVGENRCDASFHVKPVWIVKGRWMKGAIAGVFQEAQLWLRRCVSRDRRARMLNVQTLWTPQHCDANQRGPKMELIIHV